jgi:hypothetical protein
LTPRQITVEAGCDVINVGQPSDKRTQPNGRTQATDTFTETIKTRSRRKSSNSPPCHTVAKPDEQSSDGVTRPPGLQSCLNCMKRQRSAWRGGVHVHRDCPENGKESTRRVCSCTWKDSEFVQFRGLQPREGKSFRKLTAQGLLVRCSALVTCPANGLCPRQ